MEDGTPEPRTPVMIMVDASWADHSGTMQKVRARIENKSTGGACIRLSKKITVGTRLVIEGKWEKFSGEARYCRKDGREYLVGIQRDKTGWPIAAKPPEKEELPKQKTKGAARNIAEALIASRPNREDNEETQGQPEAKKEESVRMERSAEPLSGLVLQQHPRGMLGRERRKDTRAQGPEEARQKEEEIQQFSGGQETASGGPEPGKERKHMRRKWFEMGHKDEKDEEWSEIANEKQTPATRAATTVAVDASGPAAGEEDEAKVQVELLSMEDVYRMAGILNPRKGYSINKVVEMLHSEHLRGLSRDLKRASVLMALDAAGISVEEVLQDAKARQDAIDSYETDQRKQFEAQLAQKAEENVQIQAELERVKARYTERLRRNLDGMAREKATFGHWLTLKQQESQSMAEAVDLCLKAAAPEAPSTGLEEVSLAGARSKPV